MKKMKNTLLSSISEREKGKRMDNRRKRKKEGQ